MNHTQMTDREVFEKKGSEIYLDVESYPNYFLINLKYACGSKVWFVRDKLNPKMNLKKLKWILENNCTYTFNGNSYDMIVIMILLTHNVDEARLFEATQEIIGGKTPVWRMERQWAFSRRDFRFNHVDLIELAIGQSSLKTYAGRLHAPFMQDLPYHFSKVLTEDEKVNVFNYCWNDTDNTEILKNHLQPDLDLRVAMGKTYAADLRSKSDAQIAEVLFERELKWKFGVEAKKPKVEPGFSFKYRIPDTVKFQTTELQSVLQVIKDAEFRLSDDDKVVMPPAIAALMIKLGSNTYNLGLGGLHSTENWMYFEHDERYEIIDRDVASYYPRIILNQKLYPKHLTHHFLTIYNSVVERRLAAKSSGDKLVAQSLKIVINGSFGKFGSVHSILFAPELLIQTTISGQLYLLMLIERLIMNGFDVISGNTDGIVTRLLKERKNEFDAIIAEWERDTGFETEATPYLSYWARDVNSYLAVQPGGKTKSKGAFGESKLSKNPAGSIIYRAISEYISRGIKVEDTIGACTDIREYVSVRGVTGGCVDHEGNKIGKVIRYYRQKGNLRSLKYASNGHKVPLTDGCVPLMHMSAGVFPPDVDRAYYITQAKKILKSWTDKTKQSGFDF